MTNYLTKAFNDPAKRRDDLRDRAFANRNHGFTALYDMFNLLSIPSGQGASVPYDRNIPLANSLDREANKIDDLFGPSNLEREMGPIHGQEVPLSVVDSAPYNAENAGMPPTMSDVTYNRFMAGGAGLAAGISGAAVGLNPALAVPAAIQAYHLKQYSDKTENALRGRDAYNNEYTNGAAPRYDPSETWFGGIANNFVNTLNRPFRK